MQMPIGSSLETSNVSRSATETLGAEENPAESKSQVLIVDDDEAAADEMRQCLVEADFACSVVSNASEAFRFVRQNGSVAVIVTDILMPGIDGLTFIKNLRLQTTEKPIISVVFVTGDRRLENAIAAINREATAFLLKPLELSALREAVIRAAARYAERKVEREEYENRGDALQRIFAAMKGVDQGRVARRQDGPVKQTSKEIPAALVGEDDLQTRVRELVRERKARALFVDQELFNDPCWEMLLDLMAHRLAEKPVSISSLCIASGVPQTTALRRIDDLEKNGLVEKYPDQFDRRRIFVKLTNQAFHKLANYVRSMRHRP